MANLFWSVRFFADEALMLSANFVLSLASLMKSATGKTHFMRANASFRGKHSGQTGFLVANGPSINEENLSLLVGSTCFFVNQSFRHPEYAAIAPAYHVIIDDKLCSGVWDIKWLDEILKLNPEVTFLLNAKWYNDKKFQSYRRDERYKIVWIDCRKFFHKYMGRSSIDLTKTAPGVAVTGAAFTAMIFMGFKTINMLGQDGNGLCYELTNRKSHFYGSNQENRQKSIEDIEKDLCQMSLSIKQWINISSYCERNLVSVVNCTSGGVFDMFPRNTIENIIAKKS